jgi:hypothetical protein
MSSPKFVHTAFTGALVSAMLFAQSKPVVSHPSLVREFPVTMRQNVVAGTTEVGTKVEAKLTIATLVDGTVLPIGATFAGEVVESAAKSAAEPSRLAIRMDSVHWKKGSASLKVYLTAWYYPVRIVTASPNDDAASESALSSSPVRWRKGTGGANPNGPGLQPPDGHPEATGLERPRATSSVSDTRVAIKDIESTHQGDGGLVLTSTRFNIKLDKSTTYVLATGDLTSAK